MVRSYHVEVGGGVWIAKQPATLLVSCKHIEQGGLVTTDQEYARECFRLASLTEDQRIRERLHEMAREWITAAMQGVAWPGVGRYPGASTEVGRKQNKVAWPGPADVSTPASPRARALTVE